MVDLPEETNAEFFEALTKFRHALHAEPEVGFLEHDTKATLRRAFEGMGIPSEKIREMAGTGLVVDIDGTGDVAAKEGGIEANESGRRVIALRTDMDALPMTEENADLGYRSRRAGAAHMCGHDGHMATLVGTARVLFGKRHLLGRDCCVRLLCQPAEEGTPKGGGAEPMVMEGCLDGVGEVYGFHNWPAFELGQVHVIAGPTMARVTDLDIAVRGKGCHASQPQTGADPIVAGSAIVSALQTVVSRGIHYGRSAVVSISTFHAGETRNVLPDSAHLTGTVRTLEPSTAEEVFRRIRRIANDTASAHGCTADVTLRDLYPPLVNHELQVQHVKAVASSVVGPDNVTQHDLPMLGGEDFAFYTQKVPGCYYFVGTRQDGRTNTMCHGSDFDFNDKALPIAVQMYLEIVRHRLGTLEDTPLFQKFE